MDDSSYRLQTIFHTSQGIFAFFPDVAKTKRSNTYFSNVKKEIYARTLYTLPNNDNENYISYITNDEKIEVSSKKMASEILQIYFTLVN